MKDFLVMSSSRQRLQLRRPIWIFLLVSFVSVLLIGAYIFPAGSSATCFLFATKACRELDHPRLVNLRPLTDDEIASDVVIKEILKAPPVQTMTPKVAFMFLTPGSLPFEMLWEKFFHVRALLFSLYSLVHEFEELVCFHFQRKWSWTRGHVTSVTDMWTVWILVNVGERF